MNQRTRAIAMYAQKLIEAMLCLQGHKAGILRHRCQGQLSTGRDAVKHWERGADLGRN